MNMKFQSSRPDPFQTSEKVKLLFLDLSGLSLCFLAAYFVRFGNWNADILFSTLNLTFGVLIIASFYVFGSYDLTDPSRIQIVTRHVLSILLSLLIIVFGIFLFSKDRSGLFGRGVFLGAVTAFAVVSLLPRLVIWKVLQEIQKSQKWLFVLSAKNSSQLMSDLKTQEFFPQCEFIQRGENLWPDLPHKLLLNWSALVLAVSEEEKIELEKNYGLMLMEARFRNLSIIDISRFYEKSFQKVPLASLDHQWFIFNEGFTLVTHPMQIRMKRLMDLFLSFSLMCVVWPVMLIFALLIRLDSRGPVLFKQTRAGFKGKPFEVFKFRSMRDKAESAGAVWAQQNDSRVTRVGKFMRKTRIDELPQLWNVFRGDMSFIGPRPERPEFDEMLEKEIPYYALRYLVRPGITGWAQVMYPYGASVVDAKQKLEYDLFYIKNHRFWLDFIIILRTVKIVLFRKGR